MKNSPLPTALVSIVLPMYRVAGVLPQCIDALLAQTYTSLELLFVDDCSPDDSAHIVERMRPELESQGFVVHLLRHQSNRGVASARNTGLEHASGEWIFHYDADDYLAPTAIECLLREAESVGADVVGCDWALCHNGHKRMMTQPRPQSGSEAFALMCQGSLKWNLWLFLVRRSIIDQATVLRFVPGANMGEDMMFMGKVFLRSSRVAILPKVLYQYTKDAEGQLTSDYRPEHWEQVQTNICELERYIIAEKDSDDDLLILLQQLKLTLKLPLLISDRQVDYDRWISWMPEANAYIWRSRALPLRTRLLQQLAKNKQWWLVRLYYEIVMKRLYRLLYK